MKRTLLTIIPLLFLFFHPLVLSADEVDEIIRKAGTTGQPVLLYFYTKYCPYCESMDRNTLEKKEIATRIAREVLFLRIDGDTKTDVGRRYRIRAFPTTCLLDSKGNQLANVVGYMEGKDFLRLLDYLKGGHYRRLSLEDYLHRPK